MYLRHAVRHLQHTVHQRVEQALLDLGWTTDTPPWGTSKVVYSNRRLDEGDRTVVKGNLVNLSFEGEPPYEDLELGGGLISSEHIAFLDVIGVDDAISLAIAADLVDNLTGRAPGTSAYQKLRDFSTDASGVELAAYQLEMVDVARARPDNLSYKRHWQVVSWTVMLTYNGSPD